MSNPAPLAHFPPRLRSAPRARRYPRLVEAGVVAAATAACGGKVAAAGERHEPDPTLAGGIVASDGTGGEVAGGAGPSGGAGTLTGTPGGTGGTNAGIGGGDIDGGAPMPFTGGSSGLGGAAPVGAGGTPGGGAAALWDGWMSVRVGQSSECASAEQPLVVEVHVGEAAESIAVFGTRTVAAPEGTEECLPNYVDQTCVIAEEFGVSFGGVEADQVMASFSDLPGATCTNDGVQCEMPCNAATLEIDGIDRGSTFCCGSFDDPEYSRRAQAAVDQLMALVHAQLATSNVE